MSQSHPDSTTRAESTSAVKTTDADVPKATEYRYRTQPTVRPVVAKLLLVLFAGFLVSLVLMGNPELFGNPDLTQIVLWVVLFVTTVIALRLLYRVLILHRTTYTVGDDALRREFELFYRHVSRELPYDHLWGHELSRSRVQALLRCGTLRFLTGGNHRGLGFFEFEHVSEPETLRAEIREALQEHASDAQP